MKTKLTSDMVVFDDMKSAQVLYDSIRNSKNKITVDPDSHDTLRRFYYGLSDLSRIIQAVELFDEIELDDKEMVTIIEAIKADGLITDFLNNNGIEVVW